MQNPAGQIHAPDFEVILTRDPVQIAEAQALRYRVFVAEMGGGGAGVDHAAGLERDRYDALCLHLILRDRGRAPGDRVVGVYRLLDTVGAERAGGFYSEQEYDLTPLRRSGRRLLELGRSCLHPDYRGGAAMFHMWSALAAHVEDAGVDTLFGVASLHGTDINALAAPLSILHHRYLAPEDCRVIARAPQAVAMDRLPDGSYGRAAAMRAVPALIKGYLRLGGVVGQGAWVDTQFNTTDVCVIMETARLSERARAIYTRPRP